MSSEVLRVIVGSRNPVKINAAQGVFSRVFPTHSIHCEGVDAPSGVPDQPMTAEETRHGAENRVKYCQAHHQADFYVAMEGGVDNFDYGPATFAYVTIANNAQTRIGRSANLPLPPAVYQALRQGEELGHVMDRLFGTTNIKQKGGAIGLLTNGLETRESAYTQALTLALAPFLHPDVFAARD